ncbi:MAG: hypothetical protein JSS02_32770 [Planctomycetes bacterium]|nr:hypothetical protein [Planctomycetota bacterium]
MTGSVTQSARLRIQGQGQADQHQPDLFDAKLRNVVRYADPAAWTCAVSAVHALASVPDRLSGDRDRVGVIVVCDDGPQEAMQALDEAAVKGFSSPLKFPAGNPGSLVGVTCILLGFRGPTLNFIMPPASGVPAGLVMAAGWLQRNVCSHVLLTASSRAAGATPNARTLLLTAPQDGPASTSLLSPAELTWLSFVDS